MCFIEYSKETGMKEGLIFEDGELLYYKEGHLYHAGVIQRDDAIYYINSEGRAVKGEYVVHRTMTNDIIKHGTYTFGDDYKLIEGSYIAPEKRKRKKHRLKKMIRKFKKEKGIVVVLAAVALFAMIGIISFYENYMFGHGKKDGDVIVSTEDTKKITLPNLQDEVLICSVAAKQEFDGELTLEEAVITGTPYRSFVFEYQLKTESGILVLSENKDLTHAREYILDGNNTTLSIDNLKVDTTYYYKVIVDDVEYSGVFETAPSTRFVQVPGLENTRDIGGYVNQDGKTVKQGLLIRGVELDGLVHAAYYIPSNEIENVQNTFGFVYDFDLRESYLYHGEYKSRLGEDVGHEFYNSPAYGQIFNTNNHSTLRRIFTDLADPSKYPMYLHCTWGTDRTGTIVFLLQGILNMSEQDMVREYKLTGYVNPSIVEGKSLESLVEGLERCEGETMQEKIVTYLTNVVGVKESEIESIRNIFLE